MTIPDIIQTRKIEEILHFTTRNGLTGILHQRMLRARNYVKDDETLEFILKLNTKKVFDPQWKDHVNLSISRINRSLFGSSTNWHPDEKWRILAFDPIILTHEKVNFCTTNNAYWQHLIRGEGPEALNRLFANEVRGIYNTLYTRTPDMPSNWTTDIQAEVLYPMGIATEFLRKIYVRNAEDADSVAGKIAALQHSDVEILISPGKFQ